VTTNGWLMERSLSAEVMDDPSLDAERHHHALRSLARINFLSASDSIVWPAIRRLAVRDPGKPLRVLDVASGAGDVTIAIHGRARRLGLNVEVMGVDISERAVAFAQERARRAGAAVRFEQRDALAGELPDGFDVVMCSLFLHHLTTDEARRLLQAMGHAARRLVLVSDLERSRFGWWLALAASRVVTRSKVVHTDALLSVEAAFTRAELLELAQAAGLEGVEVRRRWPCRMLMTATGRQSPSAASKG
jgi:2-polyprenyl-3-methyl-5-hydroxy-6-metoxy-1,4-benzoquinol methylase